MVFEHRCEHGSQYGAIRSIASKIGGSGETLAPLGSASRAGSRSADRTDTDERERIKGGGEFATLERVDGFNTRWLLEPIGNMPPAEAEARDQSQAEGQALRPKPNALRETQDGSDSIST